MNVHMGHWLRWGGSSMEKGWWDKYFSYFVSILQVHWGKWKCTASCCQTTSDPGNGNRLLTMPLETLIRGKTSQGCYFSGFNSNETLLVLLHQGWENTPKVQWPSLPQCASRDPNTSCKACPRQLSNLFCFTSCDEVLSSPPGQNYMAFKSWPPCDSGHGLHAQALESEKTQS